MMFSNLIISQPILSLFIYSIFPLSVVSYPYVICMLFLVCYQL
jgi:hypothetical protein